MSDRKVQDQIKEMFHVSASLKTSRGVICDEPKMKRLMLAIICVWQYLCCDWGPDPPPTPPLISSIHYNNNENRAKREGGIIIHWL